MNSGSVSNQTPFEQTIIEKGEITRSITEWEKSLTTHPPVKRTMPWEQEMEKQPRTQNNRRSISLSQ